MILDYGMNIVDIEDMFPFEREVYNALYLQELEKKKQDGFT